VQAAAQLPCGGISETALNAALAMIEAVAPKDEIEAALAIQMAATHAASMSVLSWFGNGGGADRRLTALASAAARLLKAYATQVETFGAYATAAHSSSASSTSISMKEHRRLSATSTKRTIDDT
jgi:hypothetical protein